MKKLFQLGVFVASMCGFAATIYAASGPGGGGRLLMTTYWGDDKVALIDTGARPHDEELWTIDVAKAAKCLKPYDVRISKGSAQAFVSCSGSNQVVVIDIPAQQVQYAVETGLAPRDLQLFDNDKKLIVANSGSDTVSVIDVTTRRKIYDFPVSTQPYGVAVTDGGKTALVTGWTSGDVHIVDLGPTSAKVRAVIPVGLLPYTVIASPDGSRGYVAINTEDRVAAIDLRAAKVSNIIPVGKGPWSLASSPDGKSILVTNNRSNSLSLIRTDVTLPGDTAAPSFSAGTQISETGPAVVRRPKNGTVSADGQTAAFTDLANDQIVVVELPLGKIVRVINGGKAPYGIEFLK